MTCAATYVPGYGWDATRAKSKRSAGLNRNLTIFPVSRDERPCYRIMNQTALCASFGLM